MIILEDLNPEQRQQTFNAIKHRLANIIHTAEDIRVLFDNLTHEEYQQIFAASKTQLCKHIKTIEDIRGMIDYFSPTQYREVMSIIQNRIPSMLESINDFALVFFELESEMSQWILNVDGVKDQLDAIFIHSPHALDNTQTLLKNDVFVNNPEKRAAALAMIDARKTQKPASYHLQSAQTLKSLLTGLTPSERRAAIQSVTDQLPRIINSAKEMACVLNQLTRAECEQVFDVLKDNLKNKLPKMIRSSDDVFIIFSSQSTRHLTAAEKQVLFEISKLQVCAVITMITDVEDVLQCFPPVCRNEIMAIIQNRIPDMLMWIDSFALMLSQPHSEISQWILDIQGVKDKLDDFFVHSPSATENISSLLESVEFIDPEKCDAALAIINDRISAHQNLSRLQCV